MQPDSDRYIHNVEPGPREEADSPTDAVPETPTDTVPSGSSTFSSAGSTWLTQPQQPGTSLFNQLTRDHVVTKGAGLLQAARANGPRQQTPPLDLPKRGRTTSNTSETSTDNQPANTSPEERTRRRATSTPNRICDGTNAYIDTPLTNHPVPMIEPMPWVPVPPGWDTKPRLPAMRATPSSKPPPSSPSSDSSLSTMSFMTGDDDEPASDEDRVMGSAGQYVRCINLVPDEPDSGNGLGSNGDETRPADASTTWNPAATATNPKRPHPEPAAPATVQQTPRKSLGATYTRILNDLTTVHIHEKWAYMHIAHEALLITECELNADIIYCYQTEQMERIARFSTHGERLTRELMFTCREGCKPSQRAPDRGPSLKAEKDYQRTVQIMREAALKKNLQSDQE